MKKPILTALFPIAALALGLSTSPVSALDETFNFTPALSVPDGSLVGTIDVRNPGSLINVIQSVTVGINITGLPADPAFNGDLYVYLSHITPGGAGLTVLLNRVGITGASPFFGYADSGLNITLSDAALTDVHAYQTETIPAAGAPLTGTFQPDGRNISPTSAGALFDSAPRATLNGTFAGLSAKGDWTLFLADAVGGSQHVLSDWTLSISGLSGPFYWKGATDGVWATIGTGVSPNWTADAGGTTAILATPDALSDVIFSAGGAANQNTTLGQDFTVKSLTISDTAAVTINSGAGGPYTLTLSGNAGTGIDVQAGAGAVNIGANVTLAGSSDTITVNNAAGLTISGTLDGGNLNKQGSGTLTLSGNNTYTGYTYIDGGGLTVTGSIGGGSSTSELIVGLNNGGTNLTISGGGVVTNGKSTVGYSASSDNNTVVLTGAGSQWNTSSTFYLGWDGAGNIMTVSDGAKFTLSGSGNFDAVIGANDGSNDNKLTITGTNSLFTNVSSLIPPVASTLYVGRSGTGNEMDILAGGRVESFNARIGGGASSNGTTDNNKVLVDGAGSLWNVGGTLRVGSNGTNSNLTISGGGVVNVTGNTFLGYDATSTGNTALVTGTGSLWNVAALNIGRLGANNTVTVADGGALSATSITLGLLAGSSGTLQIGNGAGAGTVTSAGVTTGAGTGTVVFNHTDAAYTFAPLIAGTTSVQHNGSGTTSLTAANTYTGTTTISAGTLSVGLLDNGGAASGIGQSTNAAANLVFDGGALQYTGATATSDRAFTINSGKTATFDITQAATNLTLEGATGAATDGALVKIGLGTLTLAGTNTYTGTTSVNAGRLNINGSTSAGSQVNVATAGTLGGSGTVNGNATLTGNGVIDFGATGNIAGTLAVTGGNWNGQGSVAGQVTSSSGNFNIGAGANLTATTGVAVTGGTISATDGTAKLTGSLNYTSPASSDFGGEIAGAASTVTMNNADNTGATYFRLSGNNTYGGVTAVTSGELVANSNNALGATTAGTTVASGASLCINAGVSIGAEALTISGNGIAYPGLTLGAVFGGGNGGGTSSYAGLITLAGPATIGTNGLPTVFNLTGGIDTAGSTLTLGSAGSPAANSINISGAPVSGAGNVVVDTGVTSFDAANTYTGSTGIINGGVLKATVAGALPAPPADGGVGTTRSALALDQTGSGGSTLWLAASQAVASLEGAGSSTVNLNSNTLTIGAGAGSSTFAGAIVGTGGLTKDGASTLVLSGTNTYTGATTVSGGTLVASSTQALGVNSAVTVNANSILDLAASNTIGSLSGGGANSFVRDIPGSGTVVLTTGTLNTDATYSGIVEDGAGQLAVVKVGTGSQTFTGTNTYTGGTTLNAGTLIAGNAKAFGSGNLTLNGGTLRTTGGPLAVDIGAGNIQFNGGTYVANVGGTAPGVTHDQLKTTGVAAISGGTIALVQQNGFVLSNGTKVVLLLAAGGVVGGTAGGTALPAGSVTGLAAFSNSPLLIPTVKLYTDSVVLEAVQGSFAGLQGTLGFTPNQLAVASALDGLTALTGGKTGIIAELDFLNSQPLSTLPGNLDKIAPDELTVIFDISRSLAITQSNNLLQRLDALHTAGGGGSGSGAGGSAFSISAGSVGGASYGPVGKPGKAAPAAPEDRWGLFMIGSGEFTRIGSTTNAAGYNYETGGITAGIDYRINDHFALGLSLGYVGTNATLANGGTVDVDGGRLGLYATYFNSGFYVDAAVSGGLNSYKTRRVTPNNTIATASPDGSEVDVLLATGYDWKVGSLKVGPLFTYQYTGTRLDGFTETGAFAPLSIRNASSESSRTTVGFRATWDAVIVGRRIRPEVRAAWQHEFGDVAHQLTSTFATLGGSPFTVTGPITGRDSLLIGGGVTIQWSDRFATYFNYDGEIGRRNYESHSVSGGFRIQF